MSCSLTFILLQLASTSCKLLNYITLYVGHAMLTTGHWCLPCVQLKFLRVASLFIHWNITKLCTDSCALSLVDREYRLTRRCRKCQWPHQSCHSTVHMSACPLDCCLWQCKSYWPRQKGRPSQWPSSENKGKWV